MKTIAEIKCETDLPVLITDQEGFIVYINEKFQEIFGWTADEIAGKTLEVVIPGSFRDAHHLGFARFTMTEVSRVLNHPLKLKAVKKDGTEINAEHFITAEKVQEEWMFGATLRPLEA